MVNFPIRDNVFKIGAQIFEVNLANADDPWFGLDPIIIQTSDNSRLTTIVIDFSFVPNTEDAAIISYTLDGGTTFVAFNDGQDIQGGQSRFLRVTNGNIVNFKAEFAGFLNRCIVGEV